MKLKLYLIVFLLVTGFGLTELHAQNMYLRLKDGNCSIIPISSLQRFTFKNKKLALLYISGTSDSISLSSIAKLFFKVDTTVTVKTDITQSTLTRLDSTSNVVTKTDTIKAVTNKTDSVITAYTVVDSTITSVVQNITTTIITTRTDSTITTTSKSEKFVTVTLQSDTSVSVQSSSYVRSVSVKTSSYTTRLKTATNEITETDSNNSQLLIYPNPVNDLLYIANLPSATAPVYIYRLDGVVVVYTQVSADNNSINISSLNKGIYQIKVNGKSSKFIKL